MYPYLFVCLFIAHILHKLFEGVYVELNIKKKYILLLTSPCFHHPILSLYNSGPCDTFDSPCLASGDQFTCADLELYVFESPLP